MVKMDDKFLIPRTSKIKFQIFKGIGFIELLIIFFSLSFSFLTFYTLKELFILIKILIFVLILILTILLIIPFSENKKGWYLLMIMIIHFLKQKEFKNILKIEKQIKIKGEVKKAKKQEKGEKTNA